MYSQKNIAYLLTALEAIEKIYIYTSGIKDAAAFLELNEQLNFNACQTLLMAIGEETKKIDAGLQKESRSGENESRYR